MYAETEREREILLKGISLNVEIHFSLERRLLGAGEGTIKFTVSFDVTREQSDRRTDRVVRESCCLVARESLKFRR